MDELRPGGTSYASPGNSLKGINIRAHGIEEIRSKSLLLQVVEADAAL